MYKVVKANRFTNSVKYKLVSLIYIPYKHCKQCLLHSSEEPRKSSSPLPDIGKPEKVALPDIPVVLVLGKQLILYYL